MVVVLLLLILLLLLLPLAASEILDGNLRLPLPDGANVLQHGVDVKGKDLRVERLHHDLVLPRKRTCGEDLFTKTHTATLELWGS